MDKEIVVNIFNRISFGPKKEGNAAICDNMDKPGRYAKQNKTDMEGQTPHDFIQSGIQKNGGC